MKKEQLRTILKNEINAIKRIPYQDLLKRIDKVETKQFGEKDNFYQIEIQVFFDDPKEEKALRVFVSIDDGTLTKTVYPIQENFIIAPEENL